MGATTSIGTRANFIGRCITGLMSSPLTWFDREFDSAGNRIREDVRAAAREKWPQLLTLAKARIGDRELEIQELFEQAVLTTSTYLNEIQAPPQKPEGLLVVNFRQQLNRLARRLSRLVVSGSNQDMEPMLATAEWGKDADRHIFVQELVQRLSSRNRAVLRLRRAGYGWDEIAEMLSSNSSTLRNSFWREVRKAASKLLGIPLDRQVEEGKD